MNTEMYWYNFITGKYEHRTAPDDYSAYIPQYPVALNLYHLYVDNMHLSPVDAAIKVLEACVGEEKSEVSGKEDLHSSSDV